ncbi:MAG: hypothetical protein ACI3V4_02605 [Faecousia sp.]
MYVDKEDRDVISMCNENKRRSGITTTVGYFVPKERALQIVAEESARKRGGDGIGVAMMAMGTIAVIAMTVAALVG